MPATVGIEPETTSSVLAPGQSVDGGSAMATVTKVDLGVGERRFLLPDVGWEIYEKLLERYADRGPRMNYLRGDIELMSPLIPHEHFSQLFNFMVVAISEELRLPRNALGSTTFKKRLAGCGLEPDQCFYLANAGRIPRDRRSPDLDIDPPPTWPSRSRSPAASSTSWPSTPGSACPRSGDSTESSCQCCSSRSMAPTSNPPPARRFPSSDGRTRPVRRGSRPRR